jgi:hypothetical protein
LCVSRENEFSIENSYSKQNDRQQKLQMDNLQNKTTLLENLNNKQRDSIEHQKNEIVKLGTILQSLTVYIFFLKIRCEKNYITVMALI